MKKVFYENTSLDNKFPNIINKEKIIYLSKEYGLINCKIKIYNKFF